MSNADAATQQSAFTELTNAIEAAAKASIEVDRLLRLHYPVGATIVYARGGAREQGRVIEHLFDGSVRVAVLIGDTRKQRRVYAREVRA